MISSTLLPLLAAALGATDAPAKAEPTSPAPLVQDSEQEQGWSGSVTAGATLATGNTETKAAALSAEGIWHGDPNRFTVGANWNYQSDNTTGVIQRRVYGIAQFDHFYNEKTYSYANATGEHDYAAALDLRTTYGVGIGRQIREDEMWNIRGEAGLSYIDEDYGTTVDDPTGRGADADYVAARLAYDIDYLAGENWEFFHGGQIFPSLEDSDDVFARWDTRVKTNLTETMFAQLQWIWNYDNTPSPGKGRNDSIFALTIGWSF